MTQKEKNRLVFVLGICILFLVTLACAFPAQLQIHGFVPSATDHGKALVILNNAGCDCATNKIHGQMIYADGPAGVNFTGNIDYQADPGCVVPEPSNIPIKGDYTPRPKGEGGKFYAGLFENDDPEYNWEKCNCGGASCWKLWLEGGALDGYANWACELQGGQYTIVDNNCSP